MEGYAYTVLAADDPAREPLLPAYLTALSRHYRIRNEVVPLIRAWHAEGIEALLFKGFYLAEFVYPAPGARFHGDVDILIRPGEIEGAVHLALELGWSADRTIAHGNEAGHCATTLTSPGGSAVVDLHRYVIHRVSRVRRGPVRITETVWRDSRVRPWDGVPIREMNEVDSALVGVILQRCWSGDGWRLKAADYVDLTLLLQRAGKSRQDLLERAGRLGCDRTFRLYEKRCAPWRGVLDLRPIGMARRRRCDWSVCRERLPRPIEFLPIRVAKIPTIARELGRMARVQAAVRRRRDLHRLLAYLTPPEAVQRPLDPIDRALLVRHIRLARRLCRGNGKEGALSLYRTLRLYGYPAVFVSGIRAGEADDAAGHAWVELNGRVLPELNEPNNREVYRVNFEYPAPDAGFNGQGQPSPPR
jgi:hypothetical protein